MESPDVQSHSQESRKVLGYLILVVSAALLVAEIILFFFFRWTRVVVHNWYAGDTIEFPMNPWIVWIPVWIVVLGITWFSTCRKQAQQNHKFILIALMGAGCAFPITVGLMPQPESIRPESERPEPLFQVEPYPGLPMLRY